MTDPSPLPAPEFSVIVKISDVGGPEATGTLSADKVQRQALAKRFALPAIESLRGTYALSPEADGIRFTGRLDARAQQTCVISGDPFPVALAEDFNILFVEKDSQIPTDPVSEQEVELAAEDCDIMEYADGKLDLGEALAQTFFLALDPYPRGPAADEAAAKRGLKSKEEAGPFGALAALKDKL